VAEDKKLWEVDHPYYCETTNYYVGRLPSWESPRVPPLSTEEAREWRRDHIPGDHVELSGWAEFTTPVEDIPGKPQFGKFCWADSDPDYNLLFRWDWFVPDPDDYEDGEELPGEHLDLFWMLQRKGRFMVVSFPVRRDEEPEIREWLAGRFAHLLKLWTPFSPAAELAEAAS
jgi:hypothetical protein